VFYVRLLALVEPVSAPAAEERARSLVLLAEITTRWPALQRHLNRRVDRRHGLALLIDNAADDAGWADALARLGAAGDELAPAATHLRELLNDVRYDLTPVADLAAKLS
jgi:hypothetical protein